MALLAEPYQYMQTLAQICPATRAHGVQKVLNSSQLLKVVSGLPHRYQGFGYTWQLNPTNVHYDWEMTMTSSIWTRL